MTPDQEHEVHADSFLLASQPPLYLLIVRYQTGNGNLRFLGA